MKIWIASDSNYGRTLHVDDTILDPIAIAMKYGRGERGEIVHIWTPEHADNAQPDYTVYWNDVRGAYNYYGM